MSAAPTLLERVEAPLVNANEPESQVVELNAQPFSAVSAGEVLCTLETSKSTVEVESNHDGFVGAVHVAEFDRVEAGDPICEIYDAMPERSAAAEEAERAPAELRMTKKAEALARELGVDLSALPTDRFVTEKEVRALATPAEAVELDPAVEARIGPGALAVYGGGGLGRSLLDTIAAIDGVHAACIVDDGMDPGSSVLGIPVAGGRPVLAALREAGLTHAVNGVGAIGRIRTRIEVSRRLQEAGIDLAIVVDPSAAIAASAELAPGAVVAPQATVWSLATVGRGALINTGAIVSHDCSIGDHAHVAPGAVLAGHVAVGDGALVGMAVTTRPGLSIGAGAIVGNGSTLTDDVPEGGIVPAGSVWPA